MLNEDLLGIDIGSEEHALHFLDQEGREVQDKLWIKNDKQGFFRLADKIGKLDRTYRNLDLKPTMIKDVNKGIRSCRMLCVKASRE